MIVYISHQILPDKQACSSKPRALTEREQSEGDMMVRALRRRSTARTSGIVTIDIDHRLSTLSELEERIRTKFDLRFCCVTPPGDDYGKGRDNRDEQQAVAGRGVGMVAVKFLRSMLTQDQSKENVIGLAWGRTIGAMADAFLPVNAPDLQFVSLRGR
ncbi:sugar-binding domain-containing protein [Rhizobium sp. L43]|uniref:sugar-binding domain-containing protein n=1 Tax=Rhizobium sp. L43 TaxID=2035452 RepID=UPI00117B7F44|nr:sugar-binding domain-containing protein [Rhizobium sp. L43]